MLERDHELGRLRELVASAQAGRGAAASIVGPPGIGKTSLLTAARALAADAGIGVLSARGGELERDFAYGVIRQLLERPLRELAPAERAAVLEGAAGAAAPALALAPSGEDVADSAFAVLHGLYWVAANLAQREPAMVVVDDLHWCDAASLRFLAYLQRRLEGLPILVLTAARPHVESPLADLLGRVTADADVTRLHPAPLSVAAVKTLLPADAEPGFVSACHAASAGNPFLCTTLAAAMAAEGIAPVAREADRVTALAAHAVSAEVVRRMGVVPPPAAALARAVAVLGTDAELRHAAALAGLEEPEAAAAADALRMQGLLHGAARMDFVHPLLRAAVAEQIPAAERALLHHRAARLLGAEGLAAEQIAVHLLAAAPKRDPWVVETLRAAARTVGARGDPAAAVRYLRRALEEPPPPDARAATLHQLGVAELHAGEPESAERHLRDAVELSAGDFDLRTGAGRDLSLALRVLRRYTESVAVMDSVIRDVEEHEPDRALGLAGELHQSALMDPVTYSAVTARFDDLERPLEGRSRGERAYLAALATEACLRTSGANAIRDRARVAHERGLVDDEDPHSGLWANIAFPLIFAEGFELAAAMCQAAIDRARRQGSPAAIARAQLVRGMLNLRVGSISEAAADARTAIDIGLHAGLHTWPMAVAVLVEALVERAELEPAEAVLRETGTDGEIPELFLATWSLLARGKLRIAQARLEEATADLEEVGRRGHEGWRPWNPAMFPYRSALALASLRTGDPRRARALAEEELELARRWGGQRAIGVALCAKGLAHGSVDDLSAAARALSDSGAKLEHARALVELGAAIARTGRRVPAREPLHAGMELAHRCGASALTARARQELVAAGARPRRVMRTGVDSLTPSELRVARMAADGMANREIAQALFVTLRTVQVHLTHTYQKLGIASRDELPDALTS